MTALLNPAALAFVPTSSWVRAPTASWADSVRSIVPWRRDPPASTAGTGNGLTATPAMDGVTTLAAGLGLIGTALGAYHGYRRTRSLGWTLLWALAGGLFPIVTIPVALAQGYGEPKRD